jgi:hypothetical protein
MIYPDIQVRDSAKPGGSIDYSFIPMQRKIVALLKGDLDMSLKSRRLVFFSWESTDTGCKRACNEIADLGASSNLQNNFFFPVS